MIHSGSYALGTAHGPGGSPSICTSADNTTVNGAPTAGDIFHVQGVGFNYPAFEMTYPKSLGNPAPAISGSAGQDDITLSLAVNCNEAPGAALVCSTELTPIPPGSKSRHGKPSAHNASSTTRPLGDQPPEASGLTMSEGPGGNRPFLLPATARLQRRPDVQLGLDVPDDVVGELEVEAWPPRSGVATPARTASRVAS